MQILTENNRQERKTSSHTAAEITILKTKWNEDVKEELERNLQTLSATKKVGDAENNTRKSQ